MSKQKPEGWQSSAAAQRLRDAVAAIVAAELDTLRPLAITASVQSIGTGNAQVQAITDAENIVAYFTSNLQPTAVGQLVRVMRIREQYWIIEVLSGNEAIQGLNLIDPFVRSPTQQSECRVGLQLALPAVTFTTHGGRYQTTDAVWGVVGWVKMKVYQTLNSALVGTFEFPLQPNGTAAAWMQVIPVQDPGAYLLNTLGLEVMIDTTGFEFRIRNLTQGGTTPGGYYVDLQIGGSGWYAFTPPAGIEASSTQPLLPAWGNDSGWCDNTTSIITLGTNVKNYLGGYSTVRVRKELNGNLHYAGLIGFTGAYTANATLFSTPAGFRPFGRCIFAPYTSIPGTRLDFIADGTVISNTAFTTGGFISLEGCYVEGGN